MEIVCVMGKVDIVWLSYPMRKRNTAKKKYSVLLRITDAIVFKVTNEIFNFFLA